MYKASAEIQRGIVIISAEFGGKQSHEIGPWKPATKNMAFLDQRVRYRRYVHTVCLYNFEYQVLDKKKMIKTDR